LKFFDGELEGWTRALIAAGASQKECSLQAPRQTESTGRSSEAGQAGLFSGDQRPSGAKGLLGKREVSKRK